MRLLGIVLVQMREEEGLYTIYGLVDPRNKAICYVGMTKNLNARLSAHANMFGGNKKLVAWINELLHENLRFEVEEYDHVSDEATAREKEKYWISRWLAEEEPLKNIAFNVQRDALISYRKKGHSETKQSRAVVQAVLQFGLDDILLDLPGYASRLHMDERTFKRWLQRFSFL